MAQRISTVVIPAAGQGTRLLPLTKSTPKELLNVYDRPALQFAIDEAIALGVDRIVVVMHPDKPAIRDYLTPDPAAIAALRAQGKAVLGDVLEGIAVPDGTEVVFVDQHQPRGLGHAILCAEQLVLPGPFAVILPDDLILDTPCLPEMAAQYSDGHMIAAMEVLPEETASYGIFGLSRPSIGRCQQVSGMVEKPAAGRAPSRLAAVGRYVLDPSIFDTLKTTPQGTGGEIQLTDAINRDGQRLTLRAFRFSGTRYDCGSHDGLLGAAVACQSAARTALDEGGRPAARTASRDPCLTPA